MITTSPPGSVHFVGAAVQARRPASAGSPTCATRSSRTRTATRSGWPCARRSRASRWSRGWSRAQADAIVTVSDAIAEEMRALGPNGPVRDDRERLRLRRLRRARVPPAATRFRITHAGSFFGKRDPRPFLTALAQVDGVVARFVGDFRSADREWAAGDRRPARADPVRAAPPLARAAARLGGAAAADPRGRRPRPRRALGEGVRVPRRRAADPRARAARRRRGGADPRDRRGRRRRARRRRRDRARADRAARPLARGRARRARRCRDEWRDRGRRAGRASRSSPTCSSGWSARERRAA